MNTTMTRVQDPDKARAYFENKLAFTTGPVELDRMIKSGDNIIVADVREAEDFAKGHIPGAINVPKENWDNPTGLSKDKTNIIYCYTQTCHLAACGCVTFAGKGYPVMELEGGFEAWKANDMDIEREPTHRFRRASATFHRKE
jgi:rhodanese-related sulfurtransferase